MIAAWTPGEFGLSKIGFACCSAAFAGEAVITLEIRPNPSHIPNNPVKHMKRRNHLVIVTISLVAYLF
jgi:hypothetical protein